jgi:ferrous-iron efflux pump FieF
MSTVTAPLPIPPVTRRSIKMRYSGPVLFLDLHVLVDGRQTLFEAHALTETIEGVIQEIVPHADVTVHPEPY